MASLFGVIGIQTNFAYGVAAEKVPLVQHYEQFPGQQVSGFCNVKIDDKGNFHWQIKVYGLEPGTRGLFDLNHWAGEVDVTFIADKDGFASSGEQIVLEEDLPHHMFTQFAACTVHAAGDSHYDGMGIASAELNII